jgi:hypothetical protein
MARPEKNNVDYFPHDCTHGKGMFYIRQKHGNDGYTVWFMLLEQLGLADRHYLDLSDDIQLLFLSSEFLVSKEKLIEIIEDLVKIKAIDQELWDSFRVVYNQKFVDSVKEAYKKRTNVCTEKASLLLLLQGKRDFNRVSAPVNPVKVASNTQSKVNKSKVNKIKTIQNLSGLEIEFPFLENEEFRVNFETHLKQKKPSKEESAVKARLKTLHTVDIVTANEALLNSIGSNWAGVFPKQKTIQNNQNLSFREKDELAQKEMWDKTERMLYASKLREFRPGEGGYISQGHRKDVDSEEQGLIGGTLGQEM